jgi:protein-S-isoprenylcysteine O-methyltransferase Ste14
VAGVGAPEGPNQPLEVIFFTSADHGSSVVDASTRASQGRVENRRRRGAMSLQDLFHSVATGPLRRRQLFTPVGLVIFGLTLIVVVAGSIYTDRALNLQELFPSRLGLTIGLLLLVSGALLCGWCVLRFWKARGTPVPFNPPKELIVSGPYLWMRNPMVTGVFMCLFGLGFIMHSMSLALVWTPAYILAHVVELKRVEEPELERRFGTSYKEYRESVPMFIPRPWRRRV